MHPLIAIPATLALVIRAYSHKSLTIPGILCAMLTATIHALHPSPLPFTLLCTFFLLGTSATKVKKDIKAHLTQSSIGNSGGEGARTSIQVLANSGCASVAILCHLYKFGIGGKTPCFDLSSHSRDKDAASASILLVGIVCNYAAVAADTLSSELGILSRSKPVLITTLKAVPPGTNGGVTMAGVLSGMAGGAAIAATSLILLPFCSAENTTILSKTPTSSWTTGDKVTLFVFITGLGTIGSLLDSLLGAVLQASVVDRRTGKVVEGAGGSKVLVSAPVVSSVDTKTSDGQQTSRMIGSGRDILDNNQINFLMASIMTIAGMATIRGMQLP